MNRLHLADRIRPCLRFFGDRPRIPWAAALAAVAALSGCSGDPPTRADAKTPSTVPSVPVTASAAVSKPVPVQVRANGTVQAIATVTVMSQVDGQIARIDFSEGQDVKTGDLLFTLDQRPFEATLRQAEANLARDLAQLQQAQAALAQSAAAEKQAEANLARDTAQQENANVQVRRYQGLIQDGAISKEQYDQVRTAALAMDATIQADQAAVSNATAAIRAAQATMETIRATIRADQAVVENARIQLGYTVIRSPMDGRTGSLLVHVGSAVKARDSNSPLVVINQIHPISVAFSVPEQYLADIRKYRAAGSVRVEALIPGQEGEPAQGNLAFVNNTVDASTGTIQLKGAFPNADNRLWPGQFLNVRLTLTTRPDAVVIPSQAIQTGQQGPYVFVVKADQTVEARPIVSGGTLEDQTVVERGLVAGEQVVTDGMIRLVPGARVQIRPAAPAAIRPGNAG
ncbi:MAG TPA: efflux RND transporter periplasmic adaptor subunit [Candidatus Methylomirabilis sp.]|nr:efflux RND transporter periplasmic adaptor subunit [Candidatus Methylomirabilis sp.]